MLYLSVHYLHYYYNVYGLEYISLRYSNIYGPRQDPYGEAGVVSIFGKKMLENEPVTIFGTGNEYRDYIFNDS